MKVGKVHDLVGGELDGQCVPVNFIIYLHNINFPLFKNIAHFLLVSTLWSESNDHFPFLLLRKELENSYYIFFLYLYNLYQNPIYIFIIGDIWDLHNCVHHTIYNHVQIEQFLNSASHIPLIAKHVTLTFMLKFLKNPILILEICFKVKD